MSIIRQKLPGAALVCVMSGPFTQRGMPALYSPAPRAMAALQAGADLLLELPSLFAAREAEHFALGGVSILHQLGFVTHISFGCETENLPLLSSAAALLEKEDEPFRDALQQRLKQGLSYAAAQGIALSERLAQGRGSKAAPEEGTSVSALQSVFSAPNNILAISYLRALRRLHSPLQPLPVLRSGSYHAPALKDGEYPSATAVRAAMLSGDWAAARQACGYPPPQVPLCRPEALDLVLLSQLRQMDKAQLAALPNCNEGLENRLFAACREATDRQMLLSLLKTKRYPHTRLSRLCCHALLGFTQQAQAETPLPEYVRLLGFRSQDESLLKLFRQSAIPVISKAADGPMDSTSYQLDMRAYDLWALGARQPAGLMLRQQVQIFP